MSTRLNTTMNGTQASSSSPNPTEGRIGLYFAYCLIFVVSLVGNFFMTMIVYKTKTMRKPTNYFIVNMAMSDLLFPIFLTPWIFIDSWLISGPLGQTMCKLVPFFTDVSTAVSIQSLVLIAVDRFGAVVFPLRSPLISSRLCPFFILATWIIALAFLSPYLFVLKLVENPMVCKLQWKQVFKESEGNYFLALFIIFLYTPLVMISVLYIIIYSKIKSQKIPGEQSVNRAGEQRVKRERNVLKMSIAIVLVFAVCWLPFSIVVLLDVFARENNIRLPCGFAIFHSFAVFLARANCAINPYICFLFSENYRKGLKNLFSCFSVNHMTNEITS